MMRAILIIVIGLGLAGCETMQDVAEELRPPIGKCRTVLGHLISGEVPNKERVKRALFTPFAVQFTGGYCTSERSACLKALRGGVEGAGFTYSSNRSGRKNRLSCSFQRASEHRRIEEETRLKWSELLKRGNVKTQKDVVQNIYTSYRGSCKITDASGRIIYRYAQEKEIKTRATSRSQTAVAARDRAQSAIDEIARAVMNDFRYAHCS